MKTVLVFAVLFFAPTPLFAYNAFETTSEAEARHQYESYQGSQYQRSNPFYVSSGTFGDPGGDSNYRSY